jgi:uncharacterized protein (TIGR02246 family)
VKDNDERKIRELLDRWFEATRTGDVDDVLDLMTDDVVFLTPGRAPFGKSQFEQTSRGRPMQVDGRSEIEELEIVGDLAWMRTRIELTMTLPNDELHHRSGHTLSILRKQPDGRWLLARDANLLSP